MPSSKAYSLHVSPVVNMCVTPCIFIVNAQIVVKLDIETDEVSIASGSDLSFDCFQCHASKQ